MGDVSKVLGKGSTLEFQGKVYQVAPLTYELQAKFETWLERRAVQAVQKLKNLYSSEEYSAALAGVNGDIASGKYSFGAPASIAAGRTMPGLKEILRITLNKNHPEVDEAFVDALWDAKEKDLADAMAAIERANPSPLPETPPNGAATSTASET